MGHQCCFNIACCQEHCEAVLLSTNTALTLPAVVSQWSCTTGHQCGFEIAHSHCTGALYKAPMLLQQCLLSSHGGHCCMGHQRCFNNACSCPMVELYYGAPTLLQHCQQSGAQWSGTMGHQPCFDIACSCSTVEQYYGAPTLLQHSLPSGAQWSCTTGHQLCFFISSC